MLEINNLYKSFNVSGREVVAVDGVNLTVEEGEFVSILGPSGCGKTTTLRCVAGLEVPTSGDIVYDGESITDDPAHERNMGMMFQNIALYPHMTVAENIAYPLKVRNIDADRRKEQAKEAAEMMQIPDMLDKYPSQLSGGQRQRAALARTVVQDANAFLMDEPLSDLDAKLKAEIRKVVQRVHKEMDSPTIYVTHDQSEAMTMSDRIAVLYDGNVVQIDRPSKLYDEPNNRFIASFIGNPSMNFIEADVESHNTDTVAVDIDGYRMELPCADFDGNMPERLTLGFRPNTGTLQDSSEDGIPADVSLIERLDDRTLVTLTAPTGEIRITTKERTPEEGETLSIKLFSEDIHAFHPETTEALFHT